MKNTDFLAKLEDLWDSHSPYTMPFSVSSEVLRMLDDFSTEAYNDGHADGFSAGFDDGYDHGAMDNE